MHNKSKAGRTEREWGHRSQTIYSIHHQHEIHALHEIHAAIPRLLLQLKRSFWLNSWLGPWHVLPVYVRDLNWQPLLGEPCLSPSDSWKGFKPKSDFTIIWGYCSFTWLLCFATISIATMISVQHVLSNTYSRSKHSTTYNQYRLSHCHYFFI